MLAASDAVRVGPAVMVGQPGGWRTVLRRVVTAAVFVPLFVWTVARAPGWLFAALVAATAAVALWELVRMLEQAGQPIHGRLALGLGVALTVSFELAGRAPAVMPVLPVLVLGATVAVVLTAPLWSTGGPATAAAGLTLLAVLYVGWFLGHALLLHRLPQGDGLVLVLVGVTWIGESAAYLVGSAIGRRPLAPLISPRKTVEGAVAQLGASVVTAAALAAWLLPHWSPAQAGAVGALLGVTGQLGDLAESAIKRSAGVKDASGIIPGHGGVLDRLDGLLFNVPALYYVVRLGGLG